jgi:hypothetical protein
MEAGTPWTSLPSGHQASTVRIVRLPSSPGCATDDWRERVRDEVRHHSFALLSFVDDHHEDHEKGAEEEERKVRRKSLHQLLADHRERVRPQFFDQPANAKRRLDPDVFAALTAAAAEATKNEGDAAAARGSERAKLAGRLGDTGYCLREGIKEQLQVRLGQRMPWPTAVNEEEEDGSGDGGMMKEEMEALFEMLDCVGRRCASALVADGASARLQAMLDPLPDHLRDILHAASKERSDENEKSQGEGCSADYTSSSVMTLTHYFNTDQVRSLFFDSCGSAWHFNHYLSCELAHGTQLTA